MIQQEVESKDGLTYYSWYVIPLHGVATTALKNWPVMTTSMLQMLYNKQTCPDTHMYQRGTMCWQYKVV